jgi:integrase
MPLIGLSLAQYERRISWAAGQLGFGTITPHMFRHGGASCDAVTGATVEFIQQRGQWSQLRSCMRYMKTGRYLRRLNGLAPWLVDRAHFLEKRLSARLCAALKRAPGPVAID